MADIDLYTLTLQNDANLYKFRDDRADELVAADIDIEDHTLMLDGEDIAGLNGKVDKSSVGVANGVASLDQNGQVPTSQLPDELDISTETITGNPISFNTLTAQNAESTEVGIEPIQDLHGYSKPWVGGAGKNLLPMTVQAIKDANTSGTWSGNVYTYDGMTYTLLTDSDNNITGIKLKRSATGAAYAQFIINYSLAAGSYIVNSEDFNGSASIYVEFRDQDSTRVSTQGEDETLTITSQTDQFARIIIGKEYDPDNVIAKPMIRLSIVTDATFEPYTNICSIFPGVYNKNLLPMTVTGIKAANTTGTWSGNKYTLNSVEFTLLTDSYNRIIGININGTADANGSLLLETTNNLYLYPKDYRVNGLTVQGTNSSFRFIFTDKTHSTALAYIRDTTGGTVSVSTADYYGLQLTFYSGYQFNNMKIYPMLRDIAILDNTFEPYDTHKIEILGCGKNLLNNDCRYFSSQFATFGAPANTNDPDGTLVLDAGTYTFKAFNNSPSFINVRTNAQTVIASVSDSNTLSFELTEKLAIKISVTNASGYTGAQFQVERNNQATAYEPYNPNTNILLEVGQDVYSGKFNAETGTVTVDMGYVDLGDLTWSYWSTGLIFYTTLDDYRRQSGCKALCDSYNYVGTVNGVSATEININGSCGLLVNDSTTYRLYIKDTRYNSGTTLQTALAGKIFVYELATPLTIQLTPQQIALLKGYNYLSTNCQSLDLTYRIGEMATLGDVKDAIEDSNRNNLGIGIDISSCTTNDNKFHVPCDGYIQLGSESLTSGLIRVIIYGADNDNSKRLYEYMNITGTYQMSTTFVRKGMYCKVQSIATGAVVAFIPLI